MQKMHKKRISTDDSDDSDDDDTDDSGVLL